MKTLRWLWILLNIIYLPLISKSGPSFTFAVTVDQRNYTGSSHDSVRYYRGALEAMKARETVAFMLSPGDIDPPSDSRYTIDQVLGSGGLWFPVVGNHELPDYGNETYPGSNMDYLRAYNYDPNGPGLPPDIVRTGPSGCPQTTYSFDYANAHFAVLNVFCDSSGDTVTSGDIPDHLYDWLSADLAATSKPLIFVVGHEPAYPQPDADNGRLRHKGDSLDQYKTDRDRFWNLLKSRGVVAYFCGHTHNYSAVEIDGVWQIDAGHARGDGDTGAPSTYLLLHIDGSKVTLDAYRETFDGVYDYTDLVHHLTLRGSP